MRKQTRKVYAGNLAIGGDAPISIQSMLSVPAKDLAGNRAQAVKLEQVGCEILRFACPTKEDAALVTALKQVTSLPLVADIHFDYRIALACIEAGVDKIRINPGNIPSKEGIRRVAQACLERKIPIRIGVNSGSVSKEILARYGGPTAEALCASAMENLRLLEEENFHDIVISIKSSRVDTMVEAYRLMSSKVDYPLHLGVTEAGTLYHGIIKNAMGMGSLLLDGIGDTIRVSLTADPVEEIRAAKAILQDLGLRSFGPKITSCPTCGRTQINLIGLTERVEEALADCKKDIHVAVMGCAVNGPGEAREADVGVAGGKGEGLLFVHGEIVKKVSEEAIIPELLDLIESI